MSGHPIDLEARLDKHHAEVISVLPRQLLDLSDIDRTRDGLGKLLGALAKPALPDGMTVEDVRVPAHDGGPEVLVRLYRPADLPADSPALYWIHGGGMVLGSVDLDDASCAARAEQLQCLVASVDYRLAPEHPFPAPMNDCYAGLSWLASNAERLGVDAGRIAVGGASAGGGLAAGLALMARDLGGPSIGFQLLIYPMLDHRNVTLSSYAITDTRVWNREANRIAWSAYLGTGEDNTANDGGGEQGTAGVSPYASPAIAEDLTGLPPAYITVGEFDLFLDEDLAYAQALNRAEVQVEFHLYPGAFHGSDGLVVDSPISKRWAADEREALGRGLHGAD